MVYQDVPKSPTSAEVQLGELVALVSSAQPQGLWSGCGVIYTHEASCPATGLHYLVARPALKSPSRLSCDFAFETTSAFEHHNQV